MPRLETSRLKLSYGWLRGEDWWGDPVSANFLLVDMLLNPVIVSMTESGPPATGVKQGDMYIVAAGAYDAWTNHEGDLAMRTATGWIFATPTKGVRARLDNPAGWIWFNGTVWIDEDKASDDAPPILGTRYDVIASVTFEAAPLEYIAHVPIPEAMTLPVGAPGSVARCLVPPAGIMRIDIYRNDSAVGRVTFQPNAVKGTFDVPANVVYAAEDLFSLRVPDAPPTGFQDYGITCRMLLKGESA